jgi:hypothetical protein
MDQILSSLEIEKVIKAQTKTQFFEGTKNKLYKSFGKKKI